MLQLPCNNHINVGQAHCSFYRMIDRRPNMQPRGRIIDTFRSKYNEMPMHLRNTDNTRKYSLRRGTGLEMSKRCRERKRKLVI